MVKLNYMILRYELGGLKCTSRTSKFWLMATLPNSKILYFCKRKIGFLEKIFEQLN